VKGSIGLDKVTGKDNPATPLTPDLDNVPGILEGAFQIDENQSWLGNNALEIPDLRSDMILESFPSNLTTWGDWQSTPDAPDKHFLACTGAAGGTKGLPYDRSILAFWSHDGLIETLWNTPAYRAGQFLKANVIAVVAPDFSLWQEKPIVVSQYQWYRTQWVARFLQECGIKVVPRFEYFLPKARDFSLSGIPKNTPTLATQLHTTISDPEEVKRGFLEGLAILQPKQLLVYAGVKGRELLTEIGELPCEVEVIALSAVSEIRKKAIEREKDPYLLELRKRKKGREPGHSTGGVHR
jgi:hypothetical protein